MKIVHVLFSRTWDTTFGDFNEYYYDVYFCREEVAAKMGCSLASMEHKFSYQGNMTTTIYLNNSWKVITRTEN